MVNVRCAYARGVGTYHRMNNVPCQDYVGGKKGEEGCCVALADGAGSVDTSHKSAEIVVECIIEELSNRFYKWFNADPRIIAMEMIDLCNRAIDLSENEIKADCTLLFVAVSEKGDCLIGHIGDGAIFAIDDESNIYNISEPENGDHPNETYFVSFIYAANHLRIQKLCPSELSGLLMCSDGVEKALYNKAEKKHASAIRRIIEWCRKYPKEAVSSRLEKELDEVFREKTPDDMGIAAISFDEN